MISFLKNLFILLIRTICLIYLMVTKPNLHTVISDEGLLCWKFRHHDVVPTKLRGKFEVYNFPADLYVNWNRICFLLKNWGLAIYRKYWKFKLTHIQTLSLIVINYFKFHWGHFWDRFKNFGIWPFQKSSNFFF